MNQSLSLRIFNVVLVAIGITIAIVFVAGAALSQTGPAVVLLLPWTIGLGILALIAASAVGIGRGRTAWTILSGIEQAVRLNAPLPQMIRAIAQAESGRVSRSLEQAHQALETGAPVAVVLGSF